MRHFEVAKLLRELPVGEDFIMKLTEPLRGGFGKKFVVVWRECIHYVQILKIE